MNIIIIIFIIIIIIIIVVVAVVVVNIVTKQQQWQPCHSYICCMSTINHISLWSLVCQQSTMFHHGDYDHHHSRRCRRCQQSGLLAVLKWLLRVTLQGFFMVVRPTVPTFSSDVRIFAVTSKEANNNNKNNNNNYYYYYLNKNNNVIVWFGPINCIILYGSLVLIEKNTQCMIQMFRVPPLLFDPTLHDEGTINTPLFHKT